MDWQQITERIDNDEQTRLTDAIEVLEKLLTENSGDDIADKELMFNAGLAVLSLVNLYDYRQDITTWDDNEEEFFNLLGDLTSDTSHLPLSFNLLIRRLLDKDNRFYEQWGEAYELKEKSFNDVQEVIDCLPEVQQDASVREREEEIAQRKKKRRKEEISFLEKTVEGATEKRRSNRTKIVFVVLAGLAGVALYNQDGLYFAVFLVLLFQWGFYYGLEKKGYKDSSEYLPPLVIALAVVCALAGGITVFYHYFAKDPLPFREGIETVSSRNELIAVDKKYGKIRKDIFVTGTVSETNQHWGSWSGDIRCAVFGVAGEKAIGPSVMSLDTEDGTIGIINHLHATNEFGKFIRINWPSEGMRGSVRECLPTGTRVSIRGTPIVANTKSGEQLLRLSAWEVYVGTVEGHKRVLMANTGSLLWYTIMAWASKIWFLGTLYIFYRYGHRLYGMKKDQAG